MMGTTAHTKAKPITRDTVMPTIQRPKPGDVRHKSNNHSFAPTIAKSKKPSNKAVALLASLILLASLFGEIIRFKKVTIIGHTAALLPIGFNAYILNAGYSCPI